MVRLCCKLQSRKEFKDNGVCSNFCQRIAHTAAGTTSNQMLLFLHYSTGKYSNRRGKSCNIKVGRHGYFFGNWKSIK